MSLYTSVAPWRVLGAMALFLCTLPGNSYSLMRDGVLDAAMGASAFVRQEATETTMVLRPVSDPEQSVTVRGQSRELHTPTAPDTRKVAWNLSLCVPLVPQDTERFLTLFVPSLNAQTVMPSEFIVAASGFSEPAATKLELKLRSLIDNVPVSITAVDQIAMPGKNRNRCAQQSRGKIVTFFDADDIMHPRRTEILEHVFQEYQPKVVMHNWRRPTRLVPEARSVLHKDVRDADAMEDFGKTFECVNYSQALKDFGSFRALQLELERNHDEFIAAGWATVTRDVFDRIHYSENSRTGEDVKLLEDIMNSYGTGALVFVRLGMGVYVPRRDRERAASLKRYELLASRVHVQ